MVGLIRALKRLEWTAVKITQYGHGICSRDGEPCGCAPTEHPFELTEEEDPRGRADTCRFLAAGAKRSLWLRVRQGQLATAFPLLEQALNSAEFVMMESNSILSVLESDLHLVVLDSSRRDFKPSARDFLERADALVPIGLRLDARAWPGIDPDLFANKPTFPVSIGRYFNPKLCQYVQHRLVLLDIGTSSDRRTHQLPTKEPLWRY